MTNFDRIKNRFPNGEVRTEPPFYMVEAIADIPGCLEACMSADRLDSMRAALQKLKVTRVIAMGCGTSFNSCQAVASACHTLLNIPTAAYDAFDFCLEESPEVDASTLAISISHSGETLITCQAQEKARGLKAFTIGISGDAGSRLARSADLALTDPYGQETPFGKTRSYLSNAFLGILAALATAPAETQGEFLGHARQMTGLLRQNMKTWESAARVIAEEWRGATTHYHLTGYGIQKGNADEIGLKIMEVLGESATSLGLEEFMHGPYASFRKDMGILIFQTDPRSLEKALMVARGVAISGAKGVVITDRVDASWPENVKVIGLPCVEQPRQLALFPAAMAAQYLVYFLALSKGMIPDINGFEFHPELRNVVDIFFPPGTH
ncbi:glucosamine 6-phosphate synthetase [Longilinea arvoryzae]|uniref:Glutamine--fructose-6-phosphate aminotransferase [isomerizing] n=1 Tax=Longilinea arvoryzae TaxID=360412 RepID=A0A0S7BGC0_9CHLR|nr:SIS domain-containing protein [Longilinea arvoryzae]GAP13074.1 glucosamine 6-phosphate synthetase [Longilinea arvoryzae]